MSVSNVYANSISGKLSSD